MKTDLKIEEAKKTYKKLSLHVVEALEQYNVNHDKMKLYLALSEVIASTPSIYYSDGIWIEPCSDEMEENVMRLQGALYKALIMEDPQTSQTSALSSNSFGFLVLGDNYTPFE